MGIKLTYINLLFKFLVFCKCFSCRLYLYIEFLSPHVPRPLSCIIVLSSSRPVLRILSLVWHRVSLCVGDK